nr:MAG TPA: hypothetical protein [Caudoviricetes sp.]
MTEKYISSAWLLETIEDYKNISCWNTDVLDAETITRVLEVVENKVKGAPSIGPRKLGNKLLAAKNIALEVHLKMVKDHIEDAEGRYRRHESTNNLMLMSFCKGYITAMCETRSMLERMVSDGST